MVRRKTHLGRCTIKCMSESKFPEFRCKWCERAGRTETFCDLPDIYVYRCEVCRWNQIGEKQKEAA